MYGYLLGDKSPSYEINKYRKFATVESIKTENYLIMPGEKVNYDNIISVLRVH